jgi:cytochrome c biogenesis protein CcmG/thiol:disulfide interchange protein DsbE
MKRRTFLRVLCCAGLMGLLSQCGSGPLQPGDAAPQFSVLDPSGKRVALPDEFRGKVVLLHFWVSTCRICKGNMEVLESMHADYGSRGVVPCSVNIGETKETVEAFLRSVRVTYPILLDEESASRRLYNISGVPTTYVLSRDGIIRFRVLGPIAREQEERMVESLL